MDFVVLCGRPGSSRWSRGRDIGYVVGYRTLFQSYRVVPPTGFLFFLSSYVRGVGLSVDVFR